MFGINIAPVGSSQMSAMPRAGRRWRGEMMHLEQKTPRGTTARRPRSALALALFLACVSVPSCRVEVGLASPEQFIQMGNYYHRAGDFEQAAKYFRLALDRAEALGNDKEKARALGLLGAAYEGQGEYGRAESCFDRAVALWERASGTKSMELAMAIRNLAWFHVKRGKGGTARSLQNRALAIVRDNVGYEHPDAAYLMSDMAWSHKVEGDLPKAEGLFQDAVRILELHPDTAYPGLATALRNLAELYLAQQEWSKAEGVLMRALDIVQKVPSPDPELHSALLKGMAQALAATGRETEAGDFTRRAKALEQVGDAPE